MSAISYRPEIDGLRAIAVIPVVLFHLGFAWIEGGYLGVDVFFVISGFLITSIILKENTLATFSFKKFWKRRIQRILPALLVMVIIILLCSFFLVFKPHVKSYASDALSAIFSYSNVAMLLKFGDYWGQAAETSPFLHAWSLSVEEQFYLLYPVIITILLLKKIYPFKILALITIISFGLFLYSSATFPKYGFYLIPTRAWEMACGGLLALGRFNLPSVISRNKNLFPTLGLILILSSYFIFTGTDGIGITATLPVLGSVMIIQFSSKSEIIGRFLSSKALVYVGKISYSLYLWHWPIIVLAKQNKNNFSNNPIPYLVFTLILIIVMSILSYQFVEKPTRKMKNVSWLVCILFLMAISIIVIYKSTLIDVKYNSNFSQSRHYGLYYDISPTLGPITESNRSIRSGVILPKRDNIFKNAYAERGIISSKEERLPDIVLMGDSHGSMWAKIIDEIGEEINVSKSIYTTSGNNPLFPIPFKDPKQERKGFTKEQWFKYANSIIKNLNYWKPQILIVSCKWSSLTNDDFLNLESLIQFAAGNKITVLLLNQPPILDIVGDNNTEQYLAYLGYNPNGGYQYINMIDNTLVNSKNKELSLLSKKYSNCQLLNINQIYQDGNKALIIKGKAVLYYDDDHLNYQGTLLAKDLIKGTIKQIIEKPHTSQKSKS